jgi:hypothetical protein
MLEMDFTIVAERQVMTNAMLWSSHELTEKKVGREWFHIHARTRTCKQPSKTCQHMKKKAEKEREIAYYSPCWHREKEQPTAANRARNAGEQARG